MLADFKVAFRALVRQPVLSIVALATLVLGIGGQLFGVSRLDPLVFLGVSLLLGLVAFVASVLPARRATRVDPLEALRVE